MEALLLPSPCTSLLGSSPQIWQRPRYFHVCFPQEMLGTWGTLLKPGWWQHSLQTPPPQYKIAQTCFFRLHPNLFSSVVCLQKRGIPLTQKNDLPSLGGVQEQGLPSLLGGWIPSKLREPLGSGCQQSRDHRTQSCSDLLGAGAHSASTLPGMHTKHELIWTKIGVKS